MVIVHVSSREYRPADAGHAGQNARPRGMNDHRFIAPEETRQQQVAGVGRARSQQQ